MSVFGTKVGRFAARGRISDYGTATVPNPRNLRSLLTHRQRLHAFIGADWAKRRRAVAGLSTCPKKGRRKKRKGRLETFPASLRLLFAGGNFGKLVGKL